MNTQKGFSLIELLVVATIIVVLSAIGIVSYSQSGQSSRDSRRKADMETVRQAMVLYRSENGDYPSADGGNQVARYNDVISDLQSANYLSQPVPADPRDESPYIYSATASTGGSTFCICAQMEVENTGNFGNRNCQQDGDTDFYCVVEP